MKLLGFTLLLVGVACAQGLDLSTPQTATAALFKALAELDLEQTNAVCSAPLYRTEDLPKLKSLMALSSVAPKVRAAAKVRLTGLQVVSANAAQAEVRASYVAPRVDLAQGLGLDPERVQPAAGEAELFLSKSAGGWKVDLTGPGADKNLPFFARLHAHLGLDFLLKPVQ